MKELTLFQKAGCGLALLLVALLLVAVTATALNGITGRVSAASVRIHESADQATVDLSQQVTLREAIAGMVRANDNMAAVTQGSNANMRALSEYAIARSAITWDGIVGGVLLVILAALAAVIGWAAARLTGGDYV